MFSLFWKLCAALNGYLRYYMPTNRLIDWLRTPRGLRWAIPITLVATTVYLLAMRLCDVLVQRGGPGFLDVLVLILAWNAIKFAVVAALSTLRIATRLVRRHRGNPFAAAIS